MQSHLSRMHEFFTLDIQCLFVNVPLKRLKRPSSHNSSYNYSASIWTSEQICWSSMSRIMLCRASKPLKSVTLFRFHKFLGRLDFVIDRWFSSNSHRFQNFISVLQHNITIIIFVVCVINGTMPACLTRSACSSLQRDNIVGLQSNGSPQVSSVSRCDSSNQRV